MSTGGARSAARTAADTCQHSLLPQLRCQIISARPNLAAHLPCLLHHFNAECTVDPDGHDLVAAPPPPLPQLHRNLFDGATNA